MKDVMEQLEVYNEDRFDYMVEFDEGEFEKLKKELREFEENNE
jgi:hypothetical protein